MPDPWNSWYHVTGNTYGTWLRGSDLGFRERHHRRHVEGDYRNPPPPSKYAQLKQRSRELMTQPPVHLISEARRLAVEAMVASFHTDQIELRTLALNAHHYHILVRCPDHEPKGWIARAKGRGARVLIDAGLASPGKVWALGCGVKPVSSQSHWKSVDDYILKHRCQGAFVWHRDYGMFVPVGADLSHRPNAPAPDK